MSENQPSNQSRGFFGFFRKDANKDPPPKEMKLGNSGNMRYDKEKKRWVFDGEDLQDTKEFLPPPKEFAKKNAEVRTGSRKLYVDVLKLAEASGTSYVPANVDENNSEVKTQTKPETLRHSDEEASGLVREKEKNNTWDEKNEEFEGMLLFGKNDHQLAVNESETLSRENEVQGFRFEDRNFEGLAADESENKEKRLSLDQVKMIRDCFEFNSLDYLQDLVQDQDTQTGFFEVLSENERIKLELLQKDFQVFRFKTLKNSLKSLNFQIRLQAFEQVEELKNSVVKEQSINEGLAEELETLKSVLVYEKEKLLISEEKVKNLTDCLAEENSKNTESSEILQKLKEKTQENHEKTEEIHLKNQEIQLKDQEIQLKDQEIHLKSQEIHRKSQEIHLKDQEIYLKNQELESFQLKLQTLESENFSLSELLKSSEAETSKENLLLQAKISDLMIQIRSLEEYNGQQSKKSRKLESENRQLLHQIQETREKTSSSDVLEKSKVFAQLLKNSFFEYFEKVSELEMENLGLEERIKYLSNIVPENIEVSHSNSDHLEQVKELRENMEKITQDRDQLQKNLQDLLQDFQKNRENHFLDLEREKNNFEHAMSRINNDLSNEKLLTGQLKQQITLFKQEMTEKDSVFAQIQGNFYADLEKISSRKKVLKTKNKKLNEIVDVQNKKLQENSGKIKFLESVIRDLEETLNHPKQSQSFKTSDKYKAKKQMIEDQRKKIQYLNEENDLLQSSLLKSQQDLEELNNEFQFTKETMKDLEESLKIIQNKHKETLNETQNLRDSLLVKDSEIQLLTESNSELLTALKTKTNENQALTLELNKSEENLQLLKESGDSSKALTESLNLDLSRLNQEMIDLRTSHQILSSSHEKEQELVSALNLEKSGLLTQIDSLKTEVSAIQAENKQLLKTIKEKEENFELINQEVLKNSLEHDKKLQLESEVKVLQSELSKLQETHEQLLKNHSDLEIQLEDVRLAHSESSKYFEILQQQDEEIEKLKNLLHLESESKKNKETSINSLKQQLHESQETMNSLQTALNSFNTQKKSEEAEDSVTISKLKAEVSRLKDLESRLKQENNDLNEDIENMCSKNLQLTQKISSLASNEATLKEKTSENLGLQERLLEKDHQLARLEQRLAEKDEELALSKKHFQELLKDQSEKMDLEDYEMPESSEETKEESEPVGEARVEDSPWSLSKFLSAIFLTDSERGETSNSKLTT